MPTFDLDKADRDFYLIYGRTMAAWSDLEGALGAILVRTANLAPDVAMAIYYSARSFQGRAEMILACIPFAKTIPAGKTFLTGVVNRASAYSGARNTFAHDRHMLMLDIDASRVDRLISSPKGSTVGLEEIQRAGVNFAYLAMLLGLSLGHTRLLREPELSLELLALMPLDPVSTAVDLIRANEIALEIGRAPN